MQVTYDSQADHFSWDNTDIRYANNTGDLFGKSLTYGASLNNNPTVEDLWNSTPAWGFPFVSSNVAPSPTAAAIINGSLGQDVAGVGGYAMWNDHLYLAGTPCGTIICILRERFIVPNTLADHSPTQALDSDSTCVASPLIGVSHGRPDLL